MSYVEKLLSLKTQRNAARDTERKRIALFECEALDADLFDCDESEVLDLNERIVRYALSH